MKQLYKSDPFFQVPCINKKTTIGDVQLPMFFLKAANVIATFKADAKGIESLLKGTGLCSALSFAGKPLVFISFYEYLETTVGAYNEVGIAIPVVPDGIMPPKCEFRDLLKPTDETIIGWHIVNLPVTTKEANAAGHEIWGYPKFVADIPFELNNKNFFSSVNLPEAEVGEVAGHNNDFIMRLEGKLNLGVKAPALSGVTYSYLNDKLIRSSVNARGNYKAYLAHQLCLTVGNTQHNMADNLRLLGLDGSRPIAVMASQNFQSRLSDGAEIN